MKVTFIIQNLTESAFDRLADKSSQAKFTQLNTWAQGDLRHCVKMKIGNGSFRDKVELNQLLRREAKVEYKLEPRKGYKLATFIIL